MAAPVHPSHSPSWEEIYYKDSDHFLYKIYVVAREAIACLVTAGLFLYNAPLFTPFFFVGILFRDQLDAAFHNMEKVFKMAPIFCSIIIFLGAILAFPSSAWIACALVGLWAGKRAADLGNLYARM
jgi:hypothetical protein